MVYLKDRGFTEETIRKFKIGVGVEGFISSNGHSIDVQVIYFPMYRPKEIKNLKKLTK